MRNLATHTKSSKPSFYWYDIETTGTNPRKDRILQFAGIRTDLELNELADPDEFHVQIPPEVIPDPEAVLITGLTPTRLREQGIPEWRLMRALQTTFRRPSTCIVGYNNVRFDDEFLRFGFFRYLFPPYEHEYKNRNSRFDLLNVVRLTGALRPDGMEWPATEGVIQFNLNSVAEVNGIDVANAHDAAADVRMTLEIARLLKHRQPRLWDFVFENRDRRKIQQLLDNPAKNYVLHVDNLYSNERSCIAPVLPLLTLPGRNGRPSNNVVAVDLMRDISILLEGTADEIRQELFAKAVDKPAGWMRPPLQRIATNRVPVIVPKSTLRNIDARRLGIDKQELETARKRLLADTELLQKITAVYSEDQEFEEPDDPEERLYSGFFPNEDLRLCEELWDGIDRGRAWIEQRFQDPRAAELARRLKARVAPQNLTESERQRHMQYTRSKLLDSERGIHAKRRAIEALKAEHLPSSQLEMLQDLEQYMNVVARQFEL